MVEKVSKNGIISVNSNLRNPTRGSGYMTNETSDKTYVRISGDAMEAYLYLAVPEDEKDYTVAELLELLKEKNVTFGILEQRIEDMVSLGTFLKEVLVAQGLKPVDGVEGRYDYNFNLKPSGKPVIRKDGTVDYQSAFAVQAVKEGEVIAVYHPAITGTKGQTVTGKILEPKKGKELLPLKGKGFQCSEDKRSYIATTSGKIEYHNDRIIISNLLEIKGGLDFNNGKIEFRGDLVIHGDVESAGYIKSGGSVTIDGNVEATTIIAAKDIILRKGMHGGQKAIIKSGGNVYAKFIEGSQVEAKGDIQADVLMNSTVMAGENILISGKKATILGGSVQAGSKIDTMVAGNEAEIHTKLAVGMDEEARQRIVKIKVAFQVIDKKLKEIDKELNVVQTKIETVPQFAKDKLKEKAKELLRNKIKYISDKAEFKRELEELETRSMKSQEACIEIRKYIHPGTAIQTNSATLYIKEKQYAMGYRYESGEVAMYDLHNSL